MDSIACLQVSCNPTVEIVPPEALYFPDPQFPDPDWILGRGLFCDMTGMARASSRDQSYGLTLDAQQAEILAFATPYRANIDKVRRVVESATKSVGPEVMEVIERCQQEGRTLVVTSLDRFTRQELEALRVGRVYLIVLELGRVVGPKEVRSEAYRKRQRSVATKRSLAYKRITPTGIGQRPTGGVWKLVRGERGT